MGRARRRRPRPRPWSRPLRWRAEALDDTAHQVLAATAVLGRRVDGRLLAAMVELEEEAVVAALDSRWLSSSVTFSTFTAGVSPWCSPWTRPGAPSSP